MNADLSPDETVAAVQRAIAFAARKHAHQVRKDGLTPYVAHPFRVLFIVRHVFEVSDRVALCAAALHDTIEDTDTDYDEVAEGFGPEVADAVAALTKDMRRPEPVREAEYDEALTGANWQARLVKLADVYDNICDCHTAEMRGKARERAERAITCAGPDPLLVGATSKLRELLATAL